MLFRSVSQSRYVSYFSYCFLFIVGLFFLVVFMKNSGYSLFGESSSVSQENDASHVKYLKLLVYK